MASYLDDFVDEHRALIVSAPVRLGFWISRCDDNKGTTRDDRKELLSIESVFKKILSKTGETSFSNDVVEYALVGRSEWDQWGDSASSILDDLPRILKLIDQTLPKEAGKAYRKMLYFIAVVVAQAASEEGMEDDLSREVMGGGFIQSLLDRLSVKTDATMPENISKVEKAALQKLKGILEG